MIDIDEVIDFIKSDGLCNWKTGDNCGPVEKAMVSVMNNLLPICLELKALREVEKAAREFIKRGHPELTGSCITDHYIDKLCDCGFHKLENEITKLNEVRRG